MRIILFATLFALGRSAPISDLYFPEDDVEIFNIQNFGRTVENSTNGWLVEFYATWCGYCQRFAPHWKEFATAAAPWRNVIRVAVVACSDETNTPLCRKLGIVKYPTVKYFHENYIISANQTGVEVPHSGDYSVQDIKKGALDRLLNEIREGRGAMYPNLLPFEGDDTSGLLNATYTFLLFEKEDGRLGAELALDLHQTPNISIRYTYPNNTKLTSQLKVDTTPALVIFGRDNSSTLISENVGTKTELKKTIGQFLETNGLKLIETIPSKLQNSSVDPKPDPTHKSKVLLRQRIKKMGDVIFQSDLEAAVRYSLSQEVAAVETIKDEQLQALNSYLRILKEYFPFGYNGTFIDRIYNFTSTSKQVKGSEVQEFVKEAANASAFSSPQRFIGCLGSSPRYRGYPCSLWRLFHYLTVNSLLSNTNKTNGREVLDVMLAYVKNFFSCQHCSQHFQEMAAQRKLTDVSSLEESVLWLWEAHNVVNNRLHGDETEDPEYVKEQFPKKERCEECYSGDGAWEKEKVLQYLKEMYGVYKIQYIGTDTNVLFPGLD